MKMLFSLLLISLLSCTTYAQFEKSYWGGKLGLNITEVSETDDNEFGLSTKTGLYAELYRNFRINDLFAIQAGVNYTEKGGNDVVSAINIPDVDRKYTVSNNYLGIPLSLQLRRGKFLSELGLEAAFRLNTNVDAANSMINTGILESLWSGRDFDLGIIVGIGYTLKKFEISLRTIPGLVKVSDEIQFTDPNGSPIETDRFGVNTTVNIAVGYRLYDGD